MKICIKCKEEKPFEAFRKAKLGKDGHRTDCKLCEKKYRDSVKDKKAVYDAVYNKNLSEEKRLKYNQKALAYQKSNLPKYAAANAKRHAETMKARPKWANLKAIEDFYVRSAAWSKLSGEPHHVDHIVPISSDIVCGLHCEANLRIIPAFENVSKGNRHWPDMP